MRLRENLKIPLKRRYRSMGRGIWKMPGLLALVAAVSFAAPIVSLGQFGTPAGSTGKDGAVAAVVGFSENGTTLFISVTNDEANPTAAGQLVSDLSFVLSGGLTAGSLSSSISSSVGSSSPVTVLNSSFQSSTTTTTPSTWQLSHGSTDCVSGVSSCYFLNDLTGGSPKNMIIGPGPYSNANPSITGHAPSLAGTVVFELDNITGLSSNTTVSGVNLSFGTGPDSFTTLQACTSGCTGGIEGSPTPEPFTIMLGGVGLIGIGLLRRRKRGLTAIG